MSKLILEFEKSNPEDVMEPQPWPIGVAEDNTVTSGLGPDDGAHLIGFTGPDEWELYLYANDARTSPKAIPGLSPVFMGKDDKMFALRLKVRAIGVVGEDA